MRRKILLLIIILTAVMIFSCKTTPPVKPAEPGPTGTENKPAVTQPPAPPVVAFNPTVITQEYHSTTRTEVQQFIEKLNREIRNKNYKAWRAALSDEYFTEISSPQNLRQISEQPAMTTRKIVLRTPEDYFTHVVVPSRANSRVDDIEFISLTRVKAFTITKNRAGEEVRLRLYDLEKINDTWTIIN